VGEGFWRNLSLFLHSVHINSESEVFSPILLDVLLSVDC
jgi:hypothetical protein